MLEWNINDSPPVGEIPITYPENLQLRVGDMIVWNGNDWTPTEVILEGWQNIHAGNITSGFIDNNRLAIDASRITSGTIDYARLPPLNISGGESMPPFISSITPITPNGTQEIEILGEYFSPLTTLTIPGVTVNSLEVRSPGKIIANISKSNLAGTIAINLSNGANSNSLWAEGIKSIDIIGDPYWANVSLFIKGDGENNSTNIIDSSLTPKSISRFGDAKISTTQSKYGGSSIYFDGIGDYLSISSNDFSLAGDFTIEGWIYPLSLSGIRTILHINAGSNQGFHLYADGTKLAVDNGVYADYSSQSFFNLNAWHHIAVVKSGSLLRIFGNGVLLNTRPTQAYGSPNGMQIGQFWAGTTTANFMGYLDSIRFSNTARYSSGFDAATTTYLNT